MPLPGKALLALAPLASRFLECLLLLCSLSEPTCLWEQRASCGGAARRPFRWRPQPGSQPATAWTLGQLSQCIISDAQPR